MAGHTSMVEDGLVEMTEFDKWLALERTVLAVEVEVGVEVAIGRCQWEHLSERPGLNAVVENTIEVVLQAPEMENASLVERHMSW